MTGKLGQIQGNWDSVPGLRKHEIGVFLSNSDIMKPSPVTDPVNLFPSPSENLASLVLGEILNVHRPVCGFPGSSFTCPACTCLKKAKQQPHRQPDIRFADQLTFFQKTRWDNRCHCNCYIGSYETFLERFQNGQHTCRTGDSPKNVIQEKPWLWRCVTELPLKTELRAL